MRKLLFVLAFLAFSAHGQEFPSKPVRFVVGFGAGGPTDVIARIVAQDLSVSMGQAFIVENRPGANAIIATEFVARSAPDGYTMLFSSLSLLVNQILPGSKVQYDAFKDFAPVTFSTMTGWPSTAFMRSLKSRAIVSGGPPGVVGAMMVIGRTPSPVRTSRR